MSKTKITVKDIFSEAKNNAIISKANVDCGVAMIGGIPDGDIEQLTMAHAEALGHRITDTYKPTIEMTQDRKGIVISQTLFVFSQEQLVDLVRNVVNKHR